MKCIVLIVLVCAAALNAHPYPYPYPYPEPYPYPYPYPFFGLESIAKLASGVGGALGEAVGLGVKTVGDVGAGVLDAGSGLIKGVGSGISSGLQPEADGKAPVPPVKGKAKPPVQPVKGKAKPPVKKN